ncbi:MAG: dephospho-CoA kinase [Bacteroidales bacterium]|nr:dephospho-CoA kinase [Bacteroidales bacterium]
MLKIAITGNFGSGKSTVASIFNICFDIPVFNADNVAKQIIKNNHEVKEKLIKLLGDEAYTSDNEINTKYISHKIFNDKELLININSIIHPIVFKKFDEELSKHSQKKYILFESAIIFENNFEHKFDKIILVISPEQEKLKRIINKGYSKEEFYQRIQNQINDKLKKEKCDYVIYNDNRHSLIEQVIKIHNELLKIKNT